MALFHGVVFTVRRVEDNFFAAATGSFRMWARSDSCFLKVDGGRVYVRSFPAKRHEVGTLLCVHGGPGATHDYLLPLTDLARLGYRVVFYDALGCGRSDLPDGTDLFTMEHDLTVLEQVRRSLGAGRIHLMGSSYGGMLVLAYATRHSKNLRSLNSTGGLCDVRFATREMRRLVRGLPATTRSVLTQYERRKEFQHPEYEAALMTFYRKHLCRLWPWPEDVQSSLVRMSKPVYFTMNGPNEYTIIGNIKDIDFSSELSDISVPTLLIHGRYDEVTPSVGERIHRRISGSRLKIFPRSSHTSFWEERAAYMQLVGAFMRGVDARVGAR